MADAGKIVITPKGAYSSTKTYEWLDEVSYNGNAYIALKTVTGVTPSDDGVNWRLFMSSADVDVDANVLVPKFTEASTRSNIVSGENLSTMFGKIKKWFTDLKSHAFKDLVNNLTTETTGSALDASQGKVLQEELDGVNRNLEELENDIKIDIFSYNGFTTSNDNGVTSSLYTSDNSITVTGTTKYNSQVLKCEKKFKVVKGNTYILSGKHDGIYTAMGSSIVKFGTSARYNSDGTFFVEYVATETQEIPIVFQAQYASPGEYSFTISDVTLITKQIGNEVAQFEKDINASLDQLEYGETAGGKNQFNKNTVLVGYGLNSQTGDIGKNANFNCSDYIKVEPNITYTRSESGSTTTVVYDSSKKYISELGDNLTFTIPSNGAYVRFNITGDYLNNYSNIQFKEGTKVTSYEPYIPSVKMLTDNVDTLKNDLGEQKKIYSESTINVGRQAGTTVGDNSTAEGTDTEASGASSHSEGWLTTASNDCSHAEGNQTGASGICAHSEGNGTGANGDYSHAEGNGTKADGESSHAEGDFTKAKGNYSHAEGINTTSNGISSHAEGKSTNNAFDYVNEKTSASDIQTAWASNKFSIAKGESAHVEGKDCLALGDYSHAEGFNTIANNNCSHAEGNSTKANGFNSHAEGYCTIALNNQHAQGHYNNNATATENSDSGTSKGTAFVIGNGTYSSKSNAFRITGEGVIYSTNSSVQTGADYAEYFEWADGNPNSEDRVGRFVTFDEDIQEKIRFANEDDYILGIVSGMPSIIGNGDEDWKKRFVLDDFGRYIVEEFEYEVVVGVDEETGEEIKETKIGTKWKENPDYDSTKPYIPRKERAEWSAIGMMGVLSVYDDGTCQVNGYCKCTDGGIATACERGADTYRVIARVTDNIVKIVLKS